MWEKKNRERRDGGVEYEGKIKNKTTGNLTLTILKAGTQQRLVDARI